jgi:hypothetical protein
MSATYDFFVKGILLLLEVWIIIHTYVFPVNQKVLKRILRNLHIDAMQVSLNP